MSLYGSEPSAAVLEAAMNWLGHDIWPSSDLRRPKLHLECRAKGDAWVLPSWEIREASVDRVVVAAGILEDPFGARPFLCVCIACWPDGATLAAPQSVAHPFGLQSTMSTQGSLKLLGLPTAPGYKLSLSDIREAYRQKPGLSPRFRGSAEDMRRLNEAYQLLKQRYVRTN